MCTYFYSDLKFYLCVCVRERQKYRQTYKKMRERWGEREGEKAEEDEEGGLHILQPSLKQQGGLPDLAVSVGTKSGWLRFSWTAPKSSNLQTCSPQRWDGFPVHSATSQSYSNGWE